MERKLHPTYEIPRYLTKYKDGSIRIVYNRRIKHKELIDVIMRDGTSKTLTIKKIVEEKVSNGDFGEFIKPFSYRLAVS